MARKERRKRLPFGKIKGYMKDITLEELLSAGCHFGHQVNRRNPKANDYIFEARSNIHIINLEKTREGLLEAAKFLNELAKKGGSLVIVGTKKQARDLVKSEAERVAKSGAGNVFYVTSRWVGGMLTNTQEVDKNFKKLLDLRNFLQSDEKENYTKREVVLFEKEKNKLERLYAGIVEMKGLPDALFIVDSHLEATAVHEAKIMNVKTVAITDTNADPTQVDLAIPANDDAAGSLKLIIGYIIDAWIDGSKSHGMERDRLQAEAEDKSKVINSPKEEKEKLEKEKPSSEKAEKKIVKKEKKAPVKPKAKKAKKE